MIAVDPDGAADRAASAKRDADVTFSPDVDETATMFAHGDALTVRRIFDTIDQRAESLARAGDGRPVGLRRLAALADAVLSTTDVTAPIDSPTGRHRSGRQRRRRATRTAQAVVHLDLSTYLGLNEHPGELSGYGPITAETARRIAQDATLRRLVTDPLTGRGIDLGRASYQPSARLRRFVVARDRTCQFPGCARAATTCQLDHVAEWSRGGPTDARNLHALCQLHHTFENEATVARRGQP